VQLNNQELGFGLEVFYFVQTFSGKLQLFCDQLTDFPEINEVFGSLDLKIYHYEGGFSRSITPTTIHRPAFFEDMEPTTHLILSDLKKEN
jgi:Lrp/AsnC family leucine-responsive transcriptional regulator